MNLREVNMALSESVESLCEAKILDAETFCNQVVSKVRPGNKSLNFNHKGYGDSHDRAFINFYNVPYEDGRARGGAVAENNRMMIIVEGFSKKLGEPPPTGKLSAEVHINSYDTSRREKPFGKVRKKTAKAENILSHVVDILNRFKKEKPNLG